MSRHAQKRLLLVGGQPVRRRHLAPELDVGGMLVALVRNPGWSAECTAWLFQIVFLSLPLWAVQILQERTGDSLAPLRLSLVPRTLLYATTAGWLILFANTGSRAFIYFQF